MTGGVERQVRQIMEQRAVEAICDYISRES